MEPLGEYEFFEAVHLLDLTRTRSATAGEGARGGGMGGLSHGKLERTPASGWLHRLVRPVGEKWLPFPLLATYHCNAFRKWVESETHPSKTSAVKREAS